MSDRTGIPQIRTPPTGAEWVDRGRLGRRGPMSVCRFGWRGTSVGRVGQRGTSVNARGVENLPAAASSRKVRGVHAGCAASSRKVRGVRLVSRGRGPSRGGDDRGRRRCRKVPRGPAPAYDAAHLAGTSRTSHSARRPRGVRGVVPEGARRPRGVRDSRLVTLGRGVPKVVRSEVAPGSRAPAQWLPAPGSRCGAMAAPQRGAARDPRRWVTSSGGGCHRASPPGCRPRPPVRRRSAVGAAPEGCA
jgi:hypothetical protein